jgi:hypothetical protein
MTNKLLASFACMLLLGCLPHRQALAPGAADACTWKSNFSATGSLLQGRAGHVATALVDGKVLVTGGNNATQGSADVQLRLARTPGCRSLRPAGLRASQRRTGGPPL